MRLNRITAAAAALLLVPCGFSAAPQSCCYAESEAVTVTEGDFTYNVYDDHAEIKSYKGMRSPVEVPESVNGVPVTSVAPYGFYSCAAKDVIFPETVKDFQTQSLYGGYLNKITILADDCRIEDQADTICNAVEQHPVTGEQTPVFTGVIIGTEGSSAQKYAEKYGYSFMDINTEPTEESYEELVEDNITYYLFSDHAELARVAFTTGARNSSLVLPDEVAGLPLTVIRERSIGACGYPEITLPASIRIIERSAVETARSLTRLNILSKDCQIYDSGCTICSGVAGIKGTIIKIPKYQGVIAGYTGSTAQKYAEYYGYQFEALYSAGDVDGDSVIDASDASGVLAEYALIQTGGTSEFGLAQTAAADVNSDEKVDATDASAILQYFAYTQTGGTLGISEFLASEE